MREALLSLLSTTTGWLTNRLLVILIAAIVVLTLYGIVEEERLLWLVVSFVGARAAYLIAQIARKPPTSADWQSLNRRLVSEFSSAKARAAAARKLKVAESATPEELADALVAAEQSKWAHRRPRVEQAIECAGLFGYCLALPAAAVLYGDEIVSLRLHQDWRGLSVVLAGTALYWMPFLISRAGTKLRVFWWGLPLAPATVLVICGVQFKHPYLNPFNPDRLALAAQRVLALRDNILAGQHYDWVSRYARTLEARGDTAAAARYYQESLRLNPYQKDVLERLALLSPDSSGTPTHAGSGSALGSPREPYWAPGQAITPLPRCALDKSLESIGRSTIAIVRAGDIGERVIDATGDVLRRELGVPVCAVPGAMPLPPHTRVRGLMGGPQWSVVSLVRAFSDYTTPLPRAPVRYLLLTSADIYNGEANYLFAMSFPWGALVSTARFGDPVREQRLFEYRVAKQSLSSAMKAFGVPTSPDANSVTSYAQSLDEHDAKGNRPNAEARSIFQDNLSKMDAEWSTRQRATSTRR
jgi:predicted Zn-dependent protease